ncbi:hypothetical protein BofuT4_P137070.1 [Botrytis cinerea T4]|uniref:Uncharacterized protein n=1 Tax=Botryotinia fuckeliana (strain T4) TaxID=999810 RepID=G2YPW4_BOTF4|nr:hypothetical protein BofuT4_P137070.1 [Botrytis cinerea T4]
MDRAWFLTHCVFSAAVNTQSSESKRFAQHPQEFVLSQSHYMLLYSSCEVSNPLFSIRF